MYIMAEPARREQNTNRSRAEAGRKGRTKGAQQANKIKFTVRLCTYRQCRHNTRKEFVDFWQLKRGLTRHAMAGCVVPRPSFPHHHEPRLTGYPASVDFRSCFNGTPSNRWAGSSCIELKEPGQNVLIDQIIWPAVGGEDGFVQFPMSVLQPGGILVVQVDWVRF